MRLGLGSSGLLVPQKLARKGRASSLNCELMPLGAPGAIRSSARKVSHNSL